MTSACYPLDVDWLRPSFVALLSANLSFVAMTAVGCGTDAVGVEDCRRIELARCGAAEACGIIDNLEECRSFYRDQCLHGLPLEERPTTAEIDRCVSTIELAGTCAQAGAETPLESCERPPSTQTNLGSACDVVRQPELTVECGFLIVDPEPETDAGAQDAGGDDAGSGDSGTDA